MQLLNEQLVESTFVCNLFISTSFSGLLIELFMESFMEVLVTFLFLPENL